MHALLPLGGSDFLLEASKTHSLPPQRAWSEGFIDNYTQDM
jgi:hypothetical protein